MYETVGQTMETPVGHPCHMCGVSTTRLVLCWELPLCGHACDVAWNERVGRDIAFGAATRLLQAGYFTEDQLGLVDVFIPSE